MKLKRITKPLIIIVSFILMLNVFLQLLCMFFIHKAFAPLAPCNAPDSEAFVKEIRPPYTGKEPVEIFYKTEKERCYPVLKSISKKVSITSFDELNLNAYFAVQDSEKSTHNYVIIMHGFHDSPKNVSPFAMHFYEKGFNILVPGQRGHGWSDGNFVDMSAFSPYDVKSWIDYICLNDNNARIALWGISMGGSTVMRATGLELPSNVVCCIEDCGFTSAWDVYIYQTKETYHMPGKLLMPYFNLYIKRKFGFDCKKVSAKDDLKHSVTPTLFIHGDADTYVPFYMLDVVYDAAACPKEKFVVEKAKHARAAFTAPVEYWHAVDTFMQKYF